MNLPLDQIKLRIDAAISTLERLTQPISLGLEAHVAVCEALWRLERERSNIEQEQRTRAPRA